MLKALLAAILLALLVLIGLVFFGGRSRVSPLGPLSIDTPPPAAFVVHDDAPSTPPSTPPALPSPDPVPESLDSVMQRLRAAKPDATVEVTPGPPAPAAAPPPSPSLTPPTAPPVSPTPPARWSNVTGHGVQYRMARGGDGGVLSIDLGGSQVADVRVQAPFLALDPSAVNTRVDYLKQTILENFSGRSGGYVFNRDGSVSRGR